jgi:fibrillarin-like rRNA methylase
VPAVHDAGRVSPKGAPLTPVSDRLPSLSKDSRDFFTRAAAEASVYGEVTRRDKSGALWRRWDPYRSKLAAALRCGGLTRAFEELLSSAPALYLGAASGTTVSHLADLVSPRSLFAVELAPRSFEDLLVKLKPWPNVFPILGDAREPERYQGLVGRAACVVEDVAASDQVAVLEANCRALLGRGSPALLFVKARSIDSAKEPERVFASAKESLATKGFELIEERALEPFDRDHRALLIRWKG